MSGAFSPRGASPERIVHQDYFDVVLRDDGIVWLRRNDELYPRVGAIHGAYDAFLRVVDDWLLDRRIKSGKIGTKGKTPMAWLCDVRGAPTRRNDPEFEQVVQDRRADLLARSPFLSVLVTSATGKMQVTRMARTGSANLMIFDDFDHAVASLLERMQAETRRSIAPKS
jgi:hypothetical protein